MAHVELTSNWQARELTSWWDLPEKERAEFGYIFSHASSLDRFTELLTEKRFVNYKGDWYDVHDTEGKPPESILENLPQNGTLWNYASDSFFSGLLFGLPYDKNYDGYLWNHVIVARYIVVG
jgi:hypothetical protein